MSIIKKTLPVPIASSIMYQDIAIEDPTYDMIGKRYTARVYGVCQGITMPLIISTPVAVHRIEDVVITDAEIDAILAERPELGTDRLTGAMARAFERLYALAAETEEAPYNA